MSLAGEQFGLVSGEGEAMKYPASTGTVQPFQPPPYHLHYHVIRNCGEGGGGKKKAELM